MTPQAVAALLKSLKSKRTQVKSQATRYQTYIRKVDVQRLNIAELRQRLQKATETWEIFNKVQSEIEAIENDSVLEAAHSQQIEAFEEKYFEIVSALETWLEEKIQATQVPIPPVQGQQTERSTTPASQAANDHLKLPRVSLPTFSGNYEEWTPFRNIFQSLIDQNGALPDVQKMQYLLASLKAEAYDIISSLETSAENYKEAWDMLKERYDDSGLIIQKHIRALFEQPSIPKENHVAVRRLLDSVLKHLRALKALKRPTDNWDDLLIHLIVSKLDPTTCKEWETTVKRGDVPTFKQLTDFRSQRCRALEAAARTQRPTTSTTAQERFGQGKGVASHIVTVNKCAFCAKDDHNIYKCDEFLQLDIEQRIQEAKTRKLCLNCLKASAHPARRCGSGPCRKCNKRHNTLVHLEQLSRTQSDHTTTSTPPAGGEKVAATSVNHASVKQERQVLLATAVVNILDSKGKAQPCRALLDSGSQSCFITTKCARELGLKQRASRIPICGLGELSMQTRSVTKIALQSRINGYQAELDCLVIEKITQALPVNRIDMEDLQVPKDIILADPDFNQTSDIDLLLGAEIFLDLLCIGRIKRGEDQPIWQKTLLGWIVAGSFMIPQSLQTGTICSISINEQMNTTVPRFWQLEHVERQNIRTPEERLCEGHFGQIYKRIAGQRFVVRLPTREEKLQELGNSRDIAIRRFKVLERKLGQKPRLKMQYTEFISEYLRLGHMRELAVNSPTWDIQPHFYLPHHCVMKEMSATTKLRVVFDASSKTTRGISLNDALSVCLKNTNK